MSLKQVGKTLGITTEAVLNTAQTLAEAARDVVPSLIKDVGLTARLGLGTVVSYLKRAYLDAKAGEQQSFMRSYADANYELDLIAGLNILDKMMEKETSPTEEELKLLRELKAQIQPHIVPALTWANENLIH
jgi:hypothetical protein